MTIVFSIMAAVLCLAVLIAWHEFGHFIAARSCGVQVLRFSIGFGKSLLSWSDRKGTVYSISAIPFGGYVQMLGENSQADDDQSSSQSSFSVKPIWQRLIIVLAGPAANILLAIIFLCFVNINGKTIERSILGNISVDTPAYLVGMRSGETITNVDGKPVISWREIALLLFERIGESGTIEMTTTSKSFVERSYSFTIEDWLDNVIEPDPLASLGLVPFSPKIPAKIDKVIEGGAADRAGLISGDTILTIDSKSIYDWHQVVTLIRNAPNQELSLQIKTPLGVVERILIPDIRVEDGVDIGFAGISPQPIEFPEELLIRYQPGIFQAIGGALIDSWTLTRLTIISLYKLFVGEIALGNITGPVGIVKYAGETAQQGIIMFLSFSAYLSISLGVLNLLPIPVLDGGQALMLCYEGITRRKLPLSFQFWAMRIGAFALITFMVFATIHDIYRI